MRTVLSLLIILLMLFVVIVSCTRKEIGFGDVPGNDYTKIVNIDTVGVRLSTVMLDSFQTSGTTSMLLGKYKDPYLGVVYASPFFRLNNTAASADIPVTAIFDSLIFIVRTNHYYYGDTSRLQTIYVNELSQAISYSFNDRLYNTSNVAVKSPSLGSRTVRINPSLTDSIIIKLSQAKGLELFEKVRQRSTDVTNSNDFLNYFKGISLSVAVSDTTAVYGLKGNNTMLMRMAYHHTTPVIESKYIDFPLEPDGYAFNRLVADRTGTSLPSSTTGIIEIPSTQTNNLAFSQYGMGLLLKMTFPSLRDIVRNDDIVRLLKAELVIRPTYGSFDRLRLPAKLYLAGTDGSNIMGAKVATLDGEEVQYSSPFIDAIYGEDSHYKFNITPYIDQLLNTPGSDDHGFFLLEEYSTASMHVNRAVINDANRPSYRTQLLLSVLVVNK
jgi:hypothetical protein